MDAMSVSSARANLFELIKSVEETHKPVHILNKNGSAAVLISEEDWRAIEETLYLSSVPGLVDDILKSKKEDINKSIDADKLEW